MTSRIRKTKCMRALELRNKGLSVEQIARRLYDDTSEEAKSRVRAHISNLRKACGEQVLGSKLASLGSERPAQVLGSEFAVLGSEQKVGSESSEAFVGGLPISKQSETVEKGNAVNTVQNWFDENELSRQLADECYDNARTCFRKDAHGDACRLLELVSRFLKLSQSSRKEFDIEGIKKDVAELKKKVEEKNEQSNNGKLIDT